MLDPYGVIQQKLFYQMYYIDCELDIWIMKVDTNRHSVYGYLRTLHLSRLYILINMLPIKRPSSCWL